MAHTRTILPTYDVFTPPPHVQSSAMGKFSLFAVSPVVAAVKGLGDDAPATPGAPVVDQPAPMTPGGMAWAVMFLGMVGVLSYQAGKAMAPSRAGGSTWGWIAVPVGLFTGPIGLGIMGSVSNHRR